jgi:hypothetical protein
LTLAQKKKIINEIDAEEDYDDKRLIRKHYDVTESEVSKYRAQLISRELLPKKERSPMKRKRQTGGGCRPKLLAVEVDIKQWITQRRTGVPALPVSSKMLLAYVNREYKHLLINNKSVKYKWLKGFMKRNHLSRRKRTTTKDHNSKELMDIAAAYRVQLKDGDGKIFDNHNHSMIWNMDETPIFFDHLESTTINEKGASAITIEGTKNEKQRVTVVLCCSANGDKMPPLIIYKSKSKNPLIKNCIYEESVEVDGKQLPVFVTKNEKSWMTKEAMCAWFTCIYSQYHRMNYDNNEIDHLQSISINQSLNDGNQMNDSSIPRNHKRSPDSFLLMDNMAAHCHDNIRQITQELNIQCKFLPPNTTPHLQPLDHSLNSAFKKIYRETYNTWFESTSQRIDQKRQL